MRRFGFAIAALLVLLLAGWLRLSGLELRPVHHDESVNFEFARWLTQGQGWKYDPSAYHGPLLYYAAWPLWAARGPAEVSKFVLRLIPALAGLLAVLAALLSRRALGSAAALLCGLLIAVAPDQTFYSRMFIHEVLLAAAGLGLLLAAAGLVLNRGIWSARLVPVLAVLALSAKETAAFLLLALGLAAGATLLLERRTEPPICLGDAAPIERTVFKGLAQGSLIGLVIWAALFSSLGANPAGLLDFFAAFIFWGNTAGADHVKSVWYFLGLLQRLDWPLWLLALPAALAGLFGDRLRRFLLIAAMVSLLIYSGIPYKTPWCLMQLSICLCPLAALGAIDLWRRLKGMRLARIALALALAAGIAYMLLYSLALNLRMYSIDSEPLVYVQAQQDLEGAFVELERVVAASDEGYALPVLVLDDKHPIPFYLRRFAVVNYHTEAPEQADSAIWICPWDSYAELAGRQRDAYHERFFQTWPGTWNTLGVRRDLYERAWGREYQPLELSVTP